jgi:hypothetical protein
MAKYTGNVLTNKGKELLVRAISAGEIITFTKVEIGKGTTIVTKEELEALVDSFKVLSITSTTELEGGSYRVRVAFNNAGITEDTELREIGVFARGEDGVEILYSYCDTDSPDLIPAEASGTLERVEDIITYISNAASITAVIDQSAVQATMQDLVEGLATKEDSFIKNTAHNKNFGTGNNEVSRGDHGHTAEGVGALSAGAVSAEYDTGEKIEDKIKNLSAENFDETPLFDGIKSSTGILTLTNDWDKYKKIMIVGRSTVNSNMLHTTFYTSYVESDDSTSSQQDGECAFWDAGSSYIRGLFRDTNRNELYITERNGGSIYKVIGIGYIGG